MACQTVERANTNGANQANVQANMPPGISPGPVMTINNSESGNSDPNAPKATILQKGATPIPGIPDPTPVGKTPTPKKTPKIPGIPSEEELKREMNTPITDRSIMERKPPVMESNSSNTQANKPRTVRKP